MFESWIIICSMLFGCSPVSDVRGPYKTEELCKARGDEMLASLTKSFKGPEDVWTPQILCIEKKPTLNDPKEQPA